MGFAYSQYNRILLRLSAKRVKKNSIRTSLILKTRQGTSQNRRMEPFNGSVRNQDSGIGWATITSWVEKYGVKYIVDRGSNGTNNATPALAFQFEAAASDAQSWLQ